MGLSVWEAVDLMKADLDVQAEPRQRQIAEKALPAAAAPF
jgi:hypothetical protein